jgi:hypothetical protein
MYQAWRLYIGSVQFKFQLNLSRIEGDTTVWNCGAKWSFAWHICYCLIPNLWGVGHCFAWQVTSPAYGVKRWHLTEILIYTDLMRSTMKVANVNKNHPLLALWEFQYIETVYTEIYTWCLYMVYRIAYREYL